MVGPAGRAYRRLVGLIKVRSKKRPQQQQENSGLHVARPRSLSTIHLGYNASISQKRIAVLLHDSKGTSRFGLTVLRNPSLWLASFFLASFEQRAERVGERVGPASSSSSSSYSLNVS
jgi:hypothetical protein